MKSLRLYPLLVLPQIYIPRLVGPRLRNETKLRGLLRFLGSKPIKSTTARPTFSPASLVSPFVPLTHSYT